MAEHADEREQRQPRHGPERGPPAQLLPDDRAQRNPEHGGDREPGQQHGERAGAQVPATIDTVTTAATTQNVAVANAVTTRATSTTA